VSVDWIEKCVVARLCSGKRGGGEDDLIIGNLQTYVSKGKNSRRPSKHARGQLTALALFGIWSASYVYVPFRVFAGTSDFLASISISGKTGSGIVAEDEIEHSVALRYLGTCMFRS
jgi:hypothetical protein